MSFLKSLKVFSKILLKNSYKYITYRIHKVLKKEKKRKEERRGILFHSVIGDMVSGLGYH